MFCRVAPYFLRNAGHPAARLPGSATACAAARLFSASAARLAASAQSADHSTARFLADHKIQVHPAAPSTLLRSFDHALIDRRLHDHLAARGITAPTPIQALTIPLALEGGNLIGIARTGSGKTLSYAIPLVVNLLRQASAGGAGPRGLVLAPTRELAQQIHQQVMQVVGVLGEKLRVAVLFGGTPVALDEQRLSQPHDLVIATPGRLIDLVKRNAVSLEECKFVVVDEADRMFDMGFSDQLETIKEGLPGDRQTTFWSATWSKHIQRLALGYATERNTCKVFVGSAEPALHPNVTYHFQVVPPAERADALIELYRECTTKHGPTRLMAFTNTKRHAELIAGKLRSCRVESGYFHGGLSQRQRDSVLQGFRNCKAGILVATDVAARGIDIAGIDVLNVDLPLETDAFIHRTGRTARGNRPGNAYSFVHSSDRVLTDIAQLFQSAGKSVPPALAKAMKKSGGWGL